MKLTIFNWIVLISFIGNIFAGVYDRNWHDIVGWCVATMYFFAYHLLLSSKTNITQKESEKK